MLGQINGEPPGDSEEDVLADLQSGWNSAEQEAAAEADRQAQIRAAADISVGRYRELHGEFRDKKAEIVDRFGDIDKARNSTRESRELVEEAEFAQARYEGLKILTVEAEWGRTQDALKKLDVFIEEKFSKGNKTGIDSARFEDLSEIAKTKREAIAKRLAILTGSRAEYIEKVQKIMAPLQQRLSLSGREMDYDQLLAEAGRRIAAKREFSMEADQLLAEMRDIESSIFEVLELPGVTERLFNLTEREIKIRDEFTERILREPLVNRADRDAPLREMVMRKLCKTFLDIQIEKDGLNDPKLTVEMREKLLSALIGNFILKFERAVSNYNYIFAKDAASRDLSSHNSELKKWHEQTQSNPRDASQEADAIFFSAIIGNNPVKSNYGSDFLDINTAPQIFEREHALWPRPSEGQPTNAPNLREYAFGLDRQAMRDEYVAHRLAPYLPLYNVILAAKEAEKRLGGQAGDLIGGWGMNSSSVYGSGGVSYAQRMDGNDLLVMKGRSVTASGETERVNRLSRTIHDVTLAELMAAGQKKIEQERAEVEGLIERYRAEVTRLDAQLSSYRLKVPLLEEEIGNLQKRQTKPSDIYFLISERRKFEPPSGFLGQVIAFVKAPKLDDAVYDLEQLMRTKFWDIVETHNRDNTDSKLQIEWPNAASLSAHDFDMWWHKVSNAVQAQLRKLEDELRRARDERDIAEQALDYAKRNIQHYSESPWLKYKI